MSPERWSQVRDIAGEVLELDPPSRPEAIARACGDDADLRTHVERLVRSYDDVHSADWDPPLPLRDQLTRPEMPVLQAGDLVAGRYRVEALLGRGGMGEVYEALDLSRAHAGLRPAAAAGEQRGQAGGKVALKLVRSGRLGDARARQRLLREGQLARQIVHPQVCRVLDVVEHSLQQTPGQSLEGPAAALVMERLHGETLAERLRDAQRPFTPEETLQLGAQMADALAAAHAAGIVHRDFKPSNVMLTPDRGAVVMDFGLAVTEPTVWPRESSLTSSGMVVGTPEYMAPEQLRGQDATPRSDQYALAAVLFEMLAGERHSQGASGADEIVRRVTERPPDVREWVPEAQRWSQPLRRALDPDPEKRFASVGQLVAAVARRPLRWPWALAAAAAALFIGLWWANRVEAGLRLGVVAASDETRVLVNNALGLSNFYRIVRLPANDWAAAAARERCSYVARASKSATGVDLTLERLTGWRRQWHCQQGSTLSDGVEACALRVRQWLGDPSLRLPRYQAKLREITTASPEALRYFVAGDKLARDGQRSQAAVELMKAVDLDAGFSEAHRRLGDVLVGMNDYGRAVVHYEKALAAARSGRASACQMLHIRGLFAVDMGDRVAARPAFEELTKSCAPDPAVHYYLAGVFYAQGRPEDGRRELEESRRLAPNARYVLSAVARQAFLAGDSAGADRAARELEKAGQKEVGSRWRGVAHQLRAETSDARRLFGSLCAQPRLEEQSSYGCNLLAHSLAEDGQGAEAMRILISGAAADDRAGRNQEAATKRVAAAWLAVQASQLEKARQLVFPAVESGSEPNLMSQSAVVLRYLKQERMLDQLADRLRPLAAYPRFRAALRRVEAEAAGLRGDHGRGLNLLVEALQLEPAGTERITLARMYAAVGESARARQILAEEAARPARYWAEATAWLPNYRSALMDLQKGN